MKNFLVLTLLFFTQISFGEIGYESEENQRFKIPQLFLDRIQPINSDYWIVNTLCYNGCDDQGKAVAVSIKVRYERLFKVTLEHVQEHSCKSEGYMYEKPNCEFLGM